MPDVAPVMSRVFFVNSLSMLVCVLFLLPVQTGAGGSDQSEEN